MSKKKLAKRYCELTGCELSRGQSSAKGRPINPVLSVFSESSNRRGRRLAMSHFMQVNWTIGASGHARARVKREEEIRVEMEMGVARRLPPLPPPPPPLLLNGLRAGYPTVAPSSEIYAESWVNHPDQSAL